MLETNIRPISEALVIVKFKSGIRRCVYSNLLVIIVLEILAKLMKQTNKNTKYVEAWIVGDIIYKLYNCMSRNSKDFVKDQ